MFKKMVLHLFILGLACATSCRAEDSILETPEMLFDLKRAQADLSQRLNPILEKYQSDLTAFTIESKIVAEALKLSNSIKNQQSMLEITKRDKLWQEYEKVNPFEHAMLSNPCSKALREYQRKNYIFHEILITNNAGTNVCITNKTSDYYQADEAWWTNTFAEGEGHPHIGVLEYDNSSHIDAIPIFVPIRDIESGKVIGILKAIINVLNLYRE